jgi:phosphomannomutase
MRSQEIADVRTDDTALLRHQEAILRAVNVEAIRARRFRVAVDCCNGAAYRATPAFLRALGCEVIELHTDPDAPFPHDPEPLPENIGALCAAIRQTGADIGFAQDADADRLAIVDERGEPLGEDCSVTLAVRHVLRRRPGPVVVNISTSRMVDDVAAQHGAPVYRTRVGEINVVERMLECGAEIGGEGNGGVIATAITPCRDSFAGMALVLEALAEEGGTIRQMRNRIPAYAMVREKLDCPAREFAPALRRLLKLYKDVPVDLTDGVKAVWPDRWLSARASNTEPIIRLTSEAPTSAEAHTLMREALECLCPTG